MKSHREMPLAIKNSEAIPLIPWVDNRFDDIGFDPRSAYVEQYWLATLGPSSTWFLRYCAGLLDHTSCASLNLHEAASALGIKHEGGASSAMIRTIARACRFRTARIVGDRALAVRRRLPPISNRQFQRLSNEERRRHQEFLASLTSREAVANRQQQRARQLALGLISCGDTINETERLLSGMRMHPAIVAEAVHWACDNLSSVTENRASLTSEPSTDFTNLKVIKGKGSEALKESETEPAKAEPAKNELVVVTAG